MGKIGVVIVLLILLLVLVLSLAGGNVLKMLRNFNLKKRINIPQVLFEKSKEEQNNYVSILCPDLILYQLNSDGSVFYKFEITKKEMYDVDDDMVGLAISRPNANCDGIHLHGKTKKDGTLDQSHSTTRAALTVNTEAVRVGYDKAGFYGVVTNKNAKVFVATNEKDVKEVPYDETFGIKDGTYLLIGLQWLYFSKPQFPSFPKFKKIKTDLDSDEDKNIFVPKFVDKQTKGMKSRNVDEQHNAHEKKSSNSTFVFSKSDYMREKE